MPTLTERHAFLEPRLTRETVSGYKSLGDLVIQAADKILSPPESITVSAASEKYVNIELAGSWAPFDNSTAPYMVEPMNMTESREHKGVVFVAGAQVGKTAGLILNVAAYHLRVTGMDVMIVCPSGSAATDFAIRRVNRMIDNSPELKGQILQVRNSDNQKRKHFKNGSLLTLAHPSKNELSGKPIGIVVETDYDRMPDDIDGEGSAYDLGSKRTQTFQSYAMTIAESTPSRPVNDPKKILEPHEAPDCKGILALYNSGDRRLWYWPCPECTEYFTPKWELLDWDRTPANFIDQAATVHMVCPHCDHHIRPEDRQEMQQWGYWKAAPGRRSTIASYWLEGTAAAFTTWQELVTNYLNADKAFRDNADEGPMTKFYNTDLGRPYVPKSQESDRLPEVLMGRAENLGRRLDAEGDDVSPPYPAVEVTVPADVRMLLATVDVQKRMFVVQVHGVKRGAPADLVIVDRFSIMRSERLDASGDHDFVRPAEMQEDWMLLRDAVVLKAYPLSDGSGRRMQVKLTLCDSGGSAAQYEDRQSGSGGVTEKAYNFWREMQRQGLGARFHCLRGTAKKTDRRVWIDKPHSQQKDRFAIARGDVPVLYLNSNEVKDIVANRLAVVEPGSGLIQFPDWLPAWFYAELCAEYYDPGKGWKNPRGRRNEAWDLLYYAVGATLSPLLPLEKIDWARPPAYLREWDDNPFVLPAPVKGEPLIESVRPVRAFDRAKIDFAALAAQTGA